MSKVHILEKNYPAADSPYRCALHFACPAGNNSAGFSWQSVFLNGGVSGNSVLANGGLAPEAGQNSSTEAAAILAGSTIETVDNLTLADMTNATIDAAADDKIDEYRDRIMDQFAEYGRLRA